MSDLVFMGRWRDPNEEPPKPIPGGPELFIIASRNGMSFLTMGTDVRDRPDDYDAWAPLPALNPDGATIEDVRVTIRRAEVMTKDEERHYAALGGAFSAHADAVDRVRRLLEEA